MHPDTQLLDLGVGEPVLPADLSIRQVLSEEAVMEELK